MTNLAPVPYSPTRTLTFAEPHRGNTEAQLNATTSVGILYAVVNRLTMATAGPAWHLYKTAQSGKEEDRKEITSHAALDLWNHPNPFMPKQEFIEVFSQHIELTGESEWIVSRSPLAGSTPLELWPVRPDRMEPDPNPKTFLAGWTYKTPDSGKIPLGLDEVIQVRIPNPLDPYRGLGPVQAMLVDIDSARYSAEWNRNFFRNSAEPGGIIEVDKRLSDDEFDEMTNRWREQHLGVANAHRVAVLEQGHWVDRNYSMKDMQFTELRKLSRDVILEGFGFPKAMIGAVDDVNRANAEASEYMFARWLIVPRLDRIKGALNHELLPMFGATAKGLEFDYDSPVPEDEAADNAALTAKTNAFVALVGCGVHADDAADIVGLPRLSVALREVAAPVPVVPAAPAAPALEPANSHRTNGHRNGALV